MRRGVRAFTLVELMIVIAVIATLMSLVLGVGSALLRNAERSQVESAMAIMESAMNEYEAIRPILAGISTSLLRGEPNASTYPPTTTAGGGMYLPAAKAAAGNVSSRAEFVDSWGNRIAFVFPGRVFRFGVDQGVPDQDGTITTCIERRIGVCTNRRVCLVSPGPDGVFGVDGEPGMTGTTAAIAQARQQAASDNVLLYPLDPPP